jgi:hypothetical protein
VAGLRRCFLRHFVTSSNLLENLPSPLTRIIPSFSPRSRTNPHLIELASKLKPLPSSAALSQVVCVEASMFITSDSLLCWIFAHSQPPCLASEFAHPIRNHLLPLCLHGLAHPPPGAASQCLSRRESQPRPSERLFSTPTAFQLPSPRARISLGCSSTHPNSDRADLNKGKKPARKV